MEGQEDHPWRHPVCNPGAPLHAAAPRRDPDHLPVGDLQLGGIGWMDLDEELLHELAGRAAPGHAPRMVVIEEPSRGGQIGERLVGPLVGSLPLAGREGGLPAGAGELAHVQVGRPGMVGARAGPGEGPLVETCVTHASVAGRALRDGLKDLFGAPEAPVRAEAAGQIGQDLPVGTGLAGRLDGLAHALDRTGRVGEGALLLAPAGGGKHHVGQLGRLGEEDVLHHEEIQVLQAAADVGRVGVGHHGVLAHDEEPLQLALPGGLHHLHDRLAGRGGHLHTVPVVLELLAHLGAGHLLVAREDRRQGAHVAGPLDVVLTAQRVHARAGAPQHPAEQGQVRQGTDVVRARHVLVDPHGVEDCRVGTGGVDPGRLLDQLGGHARDLAHLLWRVGAHRRLHGLEVLHPLVDEGLVLEAVAEDDVHEPVGQRHIGAALLADVDFGVPGQLDLSGVTDDELRAVAPFVMAPLPRVWPRPLTVELCHKWAQWSTLCVPTTSRARRWRR